MISWPFRRMPILSRVVCDHLKHGTVYHKEETDPRARGRGAVDASTHAMAGPAAASDQQWMDYVTVLWEEA